MKLRNVDGHKLIFHPQRISEWIERGDCYPIYVEIGPTNRCNHKCVFCALEWLEHGNYDIDQKVMRRTLKNMATHGVKSVMFAGEGEPLLHKEISEFVQYAHKCGLSVSITTNGVLFDEKMALACLPYLTWIRFSIDAGTAETYSKIHGTGKKAFYDVIQNIKIAASLKKTKKLGTSIEAQLLLIPDNVREVVKLAEIVKKAGADDLQIKPYSQHPSSNNKFFVDYKDYSHLDKTLEKLNSNSFEVIFRKKTMQRLQKRSYNSCNGLSFFALISAKGDVIPCNLFYDNPEYVYGNIYTKHFSEIWQGEKRKKVINKIKKNGVDQCRQGCRLHAINRYLDRLNNLKPSDNFI